MDESALFFYPVIIDRAPWSSFYGVRSLCCILFFIEKYLYLLACKSVRYITGMCV